MSSKANPTVIGGFVVGALVLAAAGVMLFGGGKLLTEKNLYVMYFGGSVTGLQLGSPVSFRGVRIGSVSDIRVEYDPADASIRTPVFIEIEPDRILTIGDPGAALERRDDDARELVELLVERGLRGQLQTQSMVTGQLAIELDFHPDTPLERSGFDTEVPELPTVPSTLEQLTKTITELPIEELVNSLLATVKSLEGLLGSAELQQTPAAVNATLAEVSALARGLDERTAPLLASLERTSETAGATFGEVRTLVADQGDDLGRLLADLQQTSEAARTALATSDEAFAALRDATAGSAQLQYQLTVTLKELSGTARSLRVLAETLEQHPEALLRGKGKSGDPP